MNVITCQLCKQEILVVPDVKTMTEAIKNHAKTKHPALEYEVEDCLIAELFKKIRIKVT
jgi:hypothetical protein